MPKLVRRSFDACWTCRRRRVACNGALPACSPCRRLSLSCEGYSVRLVWVDSERRVYEPHLRRKLDPLSTWAGHQPYNDAQLRHLTNIDSDDVYCNCTLHTAASNPFRIFRQSNGCPALDRVDSSDVLSDASTVNLSGIMSGWDAVKLPTTPTVQTRSNCAWVEIILLRYYMNQAACLTMPIESRADPTEAMLLHHYVNQVAFLTMPVDSEANPWRCVYPSIAIRHSSYASRSLYDALLSQSAFHLSVLSANTPDVAQQYKVQATNRYFSALRTLRISLDYETDDFNACAATLYTLAQIEGCYAPEFHNWRIHFLGVSGLLTLFSQDSPWIMSSDAWVISQSLALSIEIAHTSSVGSLCYFQLADTILRSVSQVGKFGYTIGAGSGVIQSISKIRRLGEALSRGELPIELDVQSGKILGEIGTPESDWLITKTLENRQEYLNSLHRRIFCNAAIIYLYRTIYNVVPIAIQNCVSEILCDTVHFLDMKGGSISLWPVFIAAVETYTKHQRHMVNVWLDYSCELGISNRHSARLIINEVWKQRDQEATSRGTQPGNIAIDWRQVQAQLMIDILLL